MSNFGSSWAQPFFEGKQVLVSGGTSGIGNALAKAFAMAGAEVIATGATQDEVASAPQVAAISYRQLDVRDGAAIKELVAAQNHIHVLVNCAGINRRTDEFEPDIFEDVVAVNLHGTNRLITACRPKLKGGGAVLNFASMFSFAGAGHAPAYAASKGAIAQLTKSLAIAFAGDDIRVNALAPGWIETAMTAPARADTGRNQTILSRTPMGRWGKPEDLAGAALFLTSPLASFITGAILPVDGGYLAV